MNNEAYDAIRRSHDGATVAERGKGLLRVIGRDSAQFLNGQLTTNTLTQQPGKSVKSCLLNNTGHLIADLVVHRLTDQFWIELPIEQRDFVISTLNRFIIREKVEITNLNDDHMDIGIHGHGAADTLTRALVGRTSFIPAESLEHTEFLAGDSREVIVRYSEFSGIDGYTIIAPAEHARTLMTAMRDEGALVIDEETSDVIRIETGVPRWGRELTPEIIPLEAGLEDSIDFNKGCYMGQEIIARIKSRGHTNRQLAMLTTSADLPAMSELRAENAEDPGKVHCKVTSVADSPRLGWIGIGYVRAEVADTGTKFIGRNNSEWARVRMHEYIVD